MKMHSKSLPHLVRVILSLLVFCFLLSDSLVAQSSGGSLVPPVRISLDVDPTEERQDIDMGIQVLFIITLLSLAPSILLLMTSFTRIVIVLSFIRSALSLQGAPSNQIVIGLAFFITLFVMSPTWNTIHANAIEPYSSTGNYQRRSAQPRLPLCEGVDASSNTPGRLGTIRRHVWPSRRSLETPFERRDSGLRHQRTSHSLSNGSSSFHPLHHDRSHRGHGSHEYGHDDDATRHRVAPLEDFALCLGRRLESDRAVYRRKFQFIILSDLRL